MGEDSGAGGFDNEHMHPFSRRSCPIAEADSFPQSGKIPPMCVYGTTAWSQGPQIQKKDKVLVLKKCMVWWHLTYITEKIFLTVQRVFGLKPPEIYFGLERCGLMS